MLQHVGDNAAAVHDAVRQRLGRVDRRDPARRCSRSSSRAADRFFGEPMLNVDDLIQTRRRPRRRQHPRGRPAHELAEALRDVPAVAAVGALRAAARGRRSREAAARVLLRRGAPAVRRRAEGAARQGRAGRAARSARKASACTSSRRIRSTFPDTVLGQLGNRVQHALRAFTPRDQKAVRAAAETMRAESRTIASSRRSASSASARRSCRCSTSKAGPAMTRARVRDPARQPRRRASPPTSERRLIAASPLAAALRAVDRPRVRVRAAQGARRGVDAERGRSGERAGPAPAAAHSRRKASSAASRRTSCSAAAVRAAGASRRGSSRRSRRARRARSARRPAAR